MEDLEKWKKYVADAKGKEVEPQRTQASSPLSQQSQRAVASAELNAARMRAQAVANANTEWRVNPKTHQSHSYTPGNFWAGVYEMLKLDVVLEYTYILYAAKLNFAKQRAWRTNYFVSFRDIDKELKFIR